MVRFREVGRRCQRRPAQAHGDIHGLRWEVCGVYLSQWFAGPWLVAPQQRCICSPYVRARAVAVKVGMCLVHRGDG